MAASASVARFRAEARVGLAHLTLGPLRFRELGEGEPILFLHAALTNGLAWRHVALDLSDRFRCIVPDLPLGAHSAPARPDADLSPPSLARGAVELLDQLGIERVTLVGNDTGGALSQIIATQHPARVARLVLTNCDAFDNFPPLVFRWLKPAALIPGFLAAMGTAIRVPAIRRLPIAYGALTKHPLEPEVEEAWTEPLGRSPSVRRDVAKVLAGVSPRHTQAAAARLPELTIPALVAWAPEDRFFPYAHAARLASLIPGAQLERIEDSYTFVSEDQPEQLAALIRRLMLETAAPAVPAAPPA